MIQKIITCCFSFVLLWMTSAVSSDADADAMLKSISPQEAAALIEQNQDNPDFKIVDVRTPKEFSEGHLDKAVLVDFYAKVFSEELQKLDKDKTYLIYCRSGRRSGNTLALMKELGFKKVYDMSGGILGWNAEKLPVTK